MDDSIVILQAPTSQITQITVVALLVASALFVLGLLLLIGYFAHKTEKPLEYGNFFVVALGIATALFGFLIAFPLLASRVFTDPTQVIALLTTLFGTIVGLVGTYFGIKASGDARVGALKLASDSLTSDTTPPTVTSVNPPDGAVGVLVDASVTATFSKDMNPDTIDRNTVKLEQKDPLTPITGEVTYDTPTKRACFKPHANLTSGRTYKATITAAVKDQAGNAMAQGRTWSFMVG
jgi:hypothetical protein